MWHRMLEVATEIGETLEVTTPAEFRRWLRKHHANSAEIWLIQYKKTSGKKSISYAEALEEAICFGWIDSSIRSIDAQRYATRFTPRRPRSNWTKSNMELAERLEAQGRLTEAGRKALLAAR